MKYNKKFQTSNYLYFRPKCEKVAGDRIVTRSGVVLIHYIWTRRSVYRNIYVFLRTLLVSCASYFYRELAFLNDYKQYGIITSIWSNGYYHWLTESLPRALIMQEKFPEATPLLPVQNDKYISSLRFMGFEEIAVFPDRSNVVLHNPILTECPRSFATTDPSLLIKVRDKILGNMIKTHSMRPTRIVFVSRKNARGRTIVNEKSLITKLKNIGVEIYCFDKLSFVEQVIIMMDTYCLVSIHGAALTNMMFMPEGGSILEILPVKHGIFDYNIVRNSLLHDPCYIRLAEVFDHKHMAVFGTADKPWYCGTHMANITVKETELLKLIQGIIANRPL